eukprot:12080210-Alexandrium_andersonii.AAC.1
MRATTQLATPGSLSFARGLPILCRLCRTTAAKQPRHPPRQGLGKAGGGFEGCAWEPGGIL